MRSSDTSGQMSPALPKGGEGQALHDFNTQCSFQLSNGARKIGQVAGFESLPLRQANKINHLAEVSSDISDNN